jgi:hypothetical protein
MDEIAVLWVFMFTFTDNNNNNNKQGISDGMVVKISRLSLPLISLYVRICNFDLGISYAQ